MAATVDLATLQRQVAQGCRVLAGAGHDDLVWGHVSARDPEGRGAWMKASELGFDEVGEDDVLLVDRDGNVLEGEGGRHSEYPIHTEIQAARPDVGAVVHTHAQYAVALGASGDPLLPLSHAATMFVPPDVPRFTETGDLIRTPALGDSLARSLGDADAVLLVNHGLVTVGDDVPDAVARAVILERACAMQLKVRAHGGWASWSDAKESLSKRENIYPRRSRLAVWDYLVRTLPKA